MNAAIPLSDTYTTRRYNLHQISEVLQIAQELIKDSRAWHDSIEWDGELVTGRELCEMLDKADGDLHAHMKENS